MFPFLICQRQVTAHLKITFFNINLFTAKSPSLASTGYVYPCLSDGQTAAQVRGLGYYNKHAQIKINFTLFKALQL